MLVEMVRVNKYWAQEKTAISIDSKGLISIILKDL